jgi:hypothetical protein
MDITKSQLAALTQEQISALLNGSIQYHIVPTTAKPPVKALTRSDWKFYNVPGNVVLPLNKPILASNASQLEHIGGDGVDGIYIRSGTTLHSMGLVPNNQTLVTNIQIPIVASLSQYLIKNDDWVWMDIGAKIAPTLTPTPTIIVTPTPTKTPPPIPVTPVNVLEYVKFTPNINSIFTKTYIWKSLNNIDENVINIENISTKISINIRFESLHGSIIVPQSFTLAPLQNKKISIKYSNTMLEKTVPFEGLFQSGFNIHVRGV